MKNFPELNTYSRKFSEREILLKPFEYDGILTRVLGGRSPVNFQSVIDRPERVRRVRPPKTTILKTQPEVPPNHQAKAFLAPSLNPALKFELASTFTNNDYKTLKISFRHEMVRTARNWHIKLS